MHARAVSRLTSAMERRLARLQITCNGMTSGKLAVSAGTSGQFETQAATCVNNRPDLSGTAMVFVKPLKAALNVQLRVEYDGVPINGVPYSWPVQPCLQSPPPLSCYPRFDSVHAPCIALHMTRLACY